VGLTRKEAFLTDWTKERKVDFENKWTYFKLSSFIS